MSKKEENVKCSSCEKHYVVPEEKLYSQFTCIKCNRNVVLIGRNESLEETFPATSIPEEWRSSGISGWIKRNYKTVLLVAVAIFVLLNGTYNCSHFHRTPEFVEDDQEAPYNVTLVYTSPGWKLQPEVYFDGEMILSCTSYQYAPREFVVHKFGLSETEEWTRTIRIEAKGIGKSFKKNITIRKDKPYILIDIHQQNETMEIKTSKEAFGH